MSEDVWLSRDEMDAIDEQLRKGTSAIIERERLQSTLQAALGKIQALEVELEQAERDRDNALAAFNGMAATADRFEARLKQADRLAEALRRLSNPMGEPQTEEAAVIQIEVEEIAREALAEWERDG
jgi:hypothetical protein